MGPSKKGQKRKQATHNPALASSAGSKKDHEAGSKKLKKPRTSAPISAAMPANAVSSPAASPSFQHGGFMSQTRFAELPITKASLAATEKLGYDRMTQVQQASFPLIMQGKDLVARAKTGTGKTMAFVLPAVEIALKARAKLEFEAKQAKTAEDEAIHRARLQRLISVLILSPTRELAYQIADVAKALVAEQDLKVETLVGGIDVRVEKARLLGLPVPTEEELKKEKSKKKIKGKGKGKKDEEDEDTIEEKTDTNDSPAATSNPVRMDIVVATPGRLLDFLQHIPHLPFRFSQLMMLVLDECDRLLEMGFQTQLEEILALMPEPRKVKKPKHKKKLKKGQFETASFAFGQGRQTLLFSATLSSPSLSAMLSKALRPGYVTVDTVEKQPRSEEGQGSEAEVKMSPSSASSSASSVSAEEEAIALDDTHRHVQQEYIICPMDKQLPILYQLLQHHRQQPNHKILVFFNTTRLVQFASQLMTTKLNIQALAIHSKKTQAQRSETSEKFRQGTNIIMFSSDVSARGLDYPDVTCVIQVGWTSREQYIHRLGRTARAGKSGYGVLLLADFEKPLLNELSSLPLRRSSFKPAPAPSPSSSSANKHVSSNKNSKKNSKDGNNISSSLPWDEWANALKTVRADGKMKEAANLAWIAWLGFYSSLLSNLHWDKSTLVVYGNLFAFTLGLLEAPPLALTTATKLGLQHVKGLVLADTAEQRAEKRQQKDKLVVIPGVGKASNKGEKGKESKSKGDNNNDDLGGGFIFSNIVGLSSSSFRVAKPATHSNKNASGSKKGKGQASGAKSQSSGGKVLASTAGATIRFM